MANEQAVADWNEAADHVYSLMAKYLPMLGDFDVKALEDVVEELRGMAIDADDPDWGITAGEEDERAARGEG